MGFPIDVQLLGSCAQIIEKVVVPDLTKTFAIDQAKAVCTALQLIASSLKEKDPVVKEENFLIQEVVEKALATLPDDKDSSTYTLRRRLEKKLDEYSHQASGSLSDVRDENYRLRSLLVDTIKGLDAHSKDLPAAAVARRNQEIRSVIRYQLDRSKDLVKERQWGGDDYLSVSESD